LREPTTSCFVTKHDNVLSGLQHNLEVASRDRLFRPPVIDHAPLLSQERDRLAVHSHGRAVNTSFDDRWARLI
jgi:hypothetical protein